MSGKFGDLGIDMARFRADIEALARIGRTENGGLFRPAFGAAYEEARAWLLDRIAAAGLAGRNDPAGNVIAHVGPNEGPVVMSGSHIDTVPDGGPLDGAYGVLAALECARVIKDCGRAPVRAFEACAFADEEGHYLGCFGSAALTGQLDAGRLAAARNFEGRSLADAMRAAGFDPDRALGAARAPGEIAAYAELHIEQGPVLEREGVPIGVVTAIIGTRHRELRFLGQADHAGTTPMNARRDAFMGAAEYATRARALVLAEGAPDTVLTFGIIEARPQAVNIVPEQVRLTQEMRDIDNDLLDRMARETRTLAESVAAHHRLALEYDEGYATTPSPMAPSMRARIKAAADHLGLAAREMPSGAGHDAGFFARVTETGMIFVPSEGGRSHRRDEWTDWPALEAGANTLLHTLLPLVFDAEK